MTGTRKGAVHSWQLPNSTRELGDTIAAAPVAKQSLRESEVSLYHLWQFYWESFNKSICVLIILGLVRDSEWNLRVDRGIWRLWTA